MCNLVIYLIIRTTENTHDIIDAIRVNSIIRVTIENHQKISNNTAVKQIILKTDKIIM